ncbi:MAG: PQQ-dependent sugar dehydrogenase [Pyrinomonadaceae bacterium]
MKLFLLILTAFLFAGNCSDASSTFSESEIQTTGENLSSNGDTNSAVKFKVETVAANLEVPWGFAFLPDGNILFTERPGRVRLIETGKLKTEIIYKVPDVEPSSESGLMDISLHPDFSKNNFVYLAYAYNSDGKRVKVVRYTYDGKTFTDAKTIIENIPGAPNHAGMRARFGPDGKLYVTTGDATDWNLAQKTDSLGGKTLRLNDDGSVPQDNPFVNDKNYRPEIYTIGHRNAQGLAWSPDGLMFQTAHGPSGFEGKGGGADEVNIVERGKNYGWAEIWGNKTKEGMVAPLLEYTPACAPASAMFYTGDKFPEWKGDFFFGCLRGERIIHVKLDGRKVVSQENLLQGKLGRIREMANAPDGYIYFSTSNRDGRGSPAKEDDRIMRLVPVK